MLFLLLRILTISISKDIVSYKDQRKDNKYKYKYSPLFTIAQERNKRIESVTPRDGIAKTGPNAHITTGKENKQPELHI